MQIPKETVQRLANEWLAEVKRLRSRASCDCGCGKPISVAGIAHFKPGHDAKLLRHFRKTIQAMLSGSS
jgi:hypothetical protein